MKTHLKIIFFPLNILCIKVPSVPYYDTVSLSFKTSLKSLEMWLRLFPKLFQIFKTRLMKMVFVFYFIPFHFFRRINNLYFEIKMNWLAGKQWLAQSRIYLFMKLMLSNKIFISFQYFIMNNKLILIQLNRF